MKPRLPTSEQADNLISQPRVYWKYLSVKNKFPQCDSWIHTALFTG